MPGTSATREISAGKRSEGALRRPAMIGIDVLADQAHLADARGGQHFDFRDDAFDRPRGFRAARVGHHAERAEFIAAFLHGDECADAALANLVRRRRGEVIELAFGGEIRGKDLAGGSGAAQKLGQAVVALRSNDDIHRFLAPENFLSFGLRDAARDNDFGLPPGRGARGLKRAEFAQFGKNLLGGALADMAGV